MTTEWKKFSLIFPQNWAVSKIIILGIKCRCQSHQHTISEGKWVTEQESLPKWVINGKLMKGLITAGCNLCLAVLAVSPQECGAEREERDQKEAWGQETWFKLHLRKRHKRWLISGCQHNIMLLIYFVSRKQPWWLCGEQKYLQQGPVSRHGEPGAGEISIICTSAFHAPTTLWTKYCFKSDLS